MEDLARLQPGFRSFKSYVADDGEVVALSEWDSEDAARAWRAQAAHAQVQRRGREAYYESYSLFAGTPAASTISKEATHDFDALRHSQLRAGCKGCRRKEGRLRWRRGTQL
jgi:hypothetical protein